MIIKKIRNPKKSASEAIRVRALAQYIHTPELEDATEKCLYWGAREFFSDTLHGQMAEMVALAEDAPRSRDPIEHYVLSWRAGEHPSDAQVDEAVDLLVDELGIGGHQVFYGLHGDTGNRHLHVMVNRVNPETLKAVKINGEERFDIRALRRTGARLGASGTHVEQVSDAVNGEERTARAQRIGARARALHRAQSEAAPRQRLYWGARGLLSDSLDDQADEMVALAERAPRSRDPVSHYRITWRSGEPPTEERFKEAVDALLDEMKVSTHQAMYALHGEGGELCLDVVLNRVKPETLRTVKLNNHGGFDVKALQRACARIEHAQGWQREAGAHYAVVEKARAQGDVVAQVRETSRARAPRAPRPAQPVVDAEHRTGEKSATRRAMEQAAPAIEGATTWSQLHETLAALGMRYAPTGSGATVQVGEVFVKASAVSRRATLARLEARLGAYEESARETPHRARAPVAHPREAKPLIDAARSWQGLHRALAAQGVRYVKKGSGAVVIAGEHEAVTMKASAVARAAALRQLEARLGPYEAPVEEETHHEDMPRWDEYLAERQRHDEARHGAWQAAQAEREEAERALAKRQHEAREALFRKRSWEGQLLALQIQRSLLAAEHAREEAVLKGRLRDRQRALQARHDPFPDYPEWVNDPALAALWRDRAQPHSLLEPASRAGQATQGAMARDIRDYEGRVVGGWVLYATQAQAARGEVAFVDRGKRITLHDRGDAEAASLAAMQLAAAKWGRFRVRGSEAHKRRFARLAAEHGFELTNPELQPLIEQHRREIAERDRDEEARYGFEAATLARTFRQMARQHRGLTFVCDEAYLSSGASSQLVRIVDERGKRLYAGRHALATVALAQACVEGKPPQASAALERALQNGLERGEEARYGVEAAGLARTIRKIVTEHGQVTYAFTEPNLARGASNVMRIVDTQDKCHYEGHLTLRTLALAQACMQGDPPKPDTVLELELTLERALAHQKAQAMERGRSMGR